jgi:hypothetical protein
MVRGLRRGVQGPRESTTVDSSQTAAVPASVGVLRLNIVRVSDVTVTGEDRADVVASLHVIGRGFDKAEAMAAAQAPKVTIDISGDAVVVSLDVAHAPPPSQSLPPPWLSLKLSVPKRLAVRGEPHVGLLAIANVASAEILSSRGGTTISNVDGSVRLTHNTGALDVAHVGSLKLTTRNSRGTVKEVAGPTTIDGTGGGLALSGITGPIDVEGRNIDFTLEADARLKPQLRINTTGGEVRIRGLQVEARIDGRNSDISVVLEAPAPVTIYNQGAIVVTAPSGGYTLDAVATDGRITSEDSSITATPDGQEAHASAKIRGGGPTLTLRATRGSIEVRKAAGK